MHHALFLKTFHIDPNILFCKKKIQNCKSDGNYRIF